MKCAPTGMAFRGNPGVADGFCAAMFGDLYKDGEVWWQAAPDPATWSGCCLPRTPVQEWMGQQGPTDSRRTVQPAGPFTRRR